MVMDKAEIKLSHATLMKIFEIEQIMESEGMAEQNYNFIIGRLCDFYLNKKEKNAIR